MKSTYDYRLYLVTDRELMSSPTLAQGVEQALAGGCTMVQLREKSASTREFYETAQEIKDITRRYQVPLIINDRLDIALAIDAAGLHIGQDDLPIAAARRLLGPDKLLGVSVGSLAEAKQALADGADYLGVGAMYATATKTDATVVPPEELAAIRRNISLPIVIIGGVNQQTLPRFYGTGIDGAAVVSAILSQPDIRTAAATLKEMTRYLKIPSGNE